METRETPLLREGPVLTGFLPNLLSSFILLPTEP